MADIVSAKSLLARARCRSNKPEKRELFAEQCACRNEAYFATALAMTNSRTAGLTESGTSSFGANDAEQHVLFTSVVARMKTKPQPPADDVQGAVGVGEPIVTSLRSA